MNERTEMTELAVAAAHIRMVCSPAVTGARKSTETEAAPAVVMDTVAVDPLKRLAPASSSPMVTM